MKELLFCVCGVLCGVLSFAQFTDSTHYMAGFTATGVVNKTNTGSSTVFSNALRFGVRRKGETLNSNSSWVYGWQPHNLLNNDFSSTLDFNLYRTFPRFYYWGLATFDKSYSLKIDSRLQAGIGVAYSFVDNETAFLNISDGILYEAGKLTVTDSTTDKYNTYRNSLRLRYRFVIGKTIVLDGMHFWQPSLEDKTDYILKSNMSLSLKLRKWLGFTTVATYNKVNRTQRENLLLTFGLTVEKYF